MTTTRAAKIAALLLVVAAGFIATGCTPYTQTNRHLVRQAALVPPPTGPSSSGPMESSGDVAVEGSLSASESRTAGTLDEGAHGHIVVDKNMGLRILGGANDDIEVSGGVTFANGGLASSTAEDVSDEAFESTTVAWYEPEMRLRFVESSDADIYAVLGARAAVIPYKRHVHTSTRTNFDHSDDPNRASHTDFSQNSALQTGNKFVVLPRGGLGSYFKLASNAGITVGGLIQGVPRFFGQKETVTYCQNPTGELGDRRCSGTDPDDIDAMEMAVVGSAFGGFHVRVQKTTLGLQGFYTVGGDATWRETSPFGATLTIRQTF
jgi:hypothetical protein